MIILGIDPGMIRLGLGVIENKEGQNGLVTYGVIYNPQDADTSWNDWINSGVYRIVTDFPRFLDVVRPNVIVSELVPPGRLGSNSDSVMAAITTCKVIAYQFGIPWNGIAASTVKKSITGNHKATKAQIRNQIMAEYEVMKSRHATLKKEQKASGEKMEGLPQDAFDGVAIALAFSREIYKQHETEHSE
jgi:Holliday junction resolvasome RuvABC endonuclease subunit